MSDRVITELRALLRRGVQFVQEEADEIERCHLDPVSGEIEPASVKLEVDAKRSWLSHAKAALQ